MRFALVVVASIALAAPSLRAQNLSGRWVYEENGQTVEMTVRHDRASGRATGTFAMLGRSAPFDGVVTGGTLVIQRLGDQRASAQNGMITARFETGALIVTVTQPGQAPVTVAMSRRDDAASTASQPATSSGGSTPPPGSQSFRAGTPSDFAGEWHFASPDGTNEEVIQLAARGSEWTGELTAVEHGYFSRRTTVKARLLFRGTLTNGALQLRFWSADGSPNDSRPATANMRGEFLILSVEGNETGYARAGRSLVQDAEGSTEAVALARAVTGRVYSRTSQAGGRDGAIAGRRMRLALCGDGSIEYDASDVGSAPDGGGSMGSTVTRRGTWSVVLYAGAPTVRAQWRGTGTSYALTAFFHVRPDASGRSANVDGTDLPVTDRC